MVVSSKFIVGFFDKAYLQHQFPDHEKFGVFARAPHLEVAFTTLLFAAAWNRTQHAFEEAHTQQQCQDMIVQFCRNNGDRGRTDEFL